MTRWKITIEYDGRPYAGFQKQPDIATVQEEIEKAIRAFCQQDIGITVAGRTDSGVHALAQVAHFDLDYRHADGRPRDMSGHDMAKAINAHLVPQPIAIIHAEKVGEDFHARFGAKEKLYRYHIINRPYNLALNQGRAWWRKTDLDIAAMREAAKIFIGKHDFTTFRDTECQAKSPVRTVDYFDIETVDILNGWEIIFSVRGMSFLHHQVRNMVGTLTLVGEGKWNAEDVQKALDVKDRKAGGPTAPSDGLYLVSIDYS
jgi:tRNA pseudouridine38-40 synthase